MLDRVGGRSGKRDGGAGRAGIATVTVIGAVVAMVAALQVATWLGAGRLMAEVHGASEMKVFLAAGATGEQQKALEAKIASLQGVAAVTPGKQVLDVRVSDPSAAGRVKEAAAGNPAVNARIPTSDTTQPSQQLSAELALFRLFWPLGALLLAVGASASLVLLDFEVRKRLAEPGIRRSISQAGAWRQHWLARYFGNLGTYAWRWQRRRVSAWVVTVVAVGAMLSMASAVQLIVWLGGEGIASQLHAASEMQVFLADGAAADQQNALKTRLAAVPGVTHLTYRSKADAQARAARDPQLATLAAASDGNPFPASFVVQMSDPAVARSVLKVVAGDPAVDRKIPASYTASQAQRLSSALRAIQVAAWAVDGIALGVGALVALSLLRSEIRARRQELRILALVGVPWVVVRLPLVIQALSVSLAGSLLAVLSLSYVGNSLVPALDRSLPFLRLGDPGPAFMALSVGVVGASCLALTSCALLVRLPR